jgi:hypothetical protein
MPPEDDRRLDEDEAPTQPGLRSRAGGARGVLPRSRAARGEIQDGVPHEVLAEITERSRKVAIEAARSAVKRRKRPTVEYLRQHGLLLVLALAILMTGAVAMALLDRDDLANVITAGLMATLLPAIVGMWPRRQ